MLTNIASSFQSAKRNYDKGLQALSECFAVASECLETLSTHSVLRAFGDFTLGDYKLAYNVAASGEAISRPFRPDLFIHDPAAFRVASAQAIERLESGGDLDLGIDQVIYTAVMAFSLSYDLWKPKSRKTPGTFFEIVIGSASRVLFHAYVLTKHIPIRDVPTANAVDALAQTVVGGEEDDAAQFSGDAVSTDLVITNPRTGKGAIIPLKITTRERIVQPFAHQRILDSAYPGQYASFVACISEVQRNDKTQTVNQICVPGTIALFQKHLARINGLYYCDVPRRYAQEDLKRVIPVKPFHTLFRDVASHLDSG